MFLVGRASRSGQSTFIQALDAIGLYDVIKVVEIAVGFCLVFNLFVPLALVLEFPITLRIFWINTFVDAAPRELFTGPREPFYNGFLLAAYAGCFTRMLTPTAHARPIWQGDVARTIAETLRGQQQDLRHERLH